MLQHRFAALTTAHVADACMRARVPVRCSCALLRAVVPGSRLAGRVCPARHAGSVGAFLEAFETAAPGDVLVVDNGGRLDEASASCAPSFRTTSYRLQRRRVALRRPAARTEPYADTLSCDHTRMLAGIRRYAGVGQPEMTRPGALQ